MMVGVQRHVRLSLVDGRVVLVGFQEIFLRDEHNRARGQLTFTEARELFDAEPEPQRSSNLNILQRHHRSPEPAPPPASG